MTSTIARSRSSFSVLALCAMTAACAGTPRVTNATPARFPRSAGGYLLTANVAPDRTRIVDVNAVVDGVPWPMNTTVDGTYTVTLLPSPCVGTLSYEYAIRYRKSQLGGGYTSTIDTLLSPDVGSYVLGIEGDAPAPCPATFSKIFYVNVSGDAVDSNLADGACATVDGNCSLRAAIMQANGNTGHDIIQLPTGSYSLTLTGTETLDLPDAAFGDLDVTDGVSVLGSATATTSVVGGNQRIFDLHLAPGAGFVQLADMTLRDGAPGTGPGGALINRGEARLERVHFQNNRVSDSMTCGNNVVVRDCNRGGAIFNEGRLAISNSTFSSNRTCSSTSCAGVSGQGGAISSLGSAASVDVVNSTFDRNSARFVGGIMNRLGTLNILNSTFNDNSGAWGSAVWTSDGNTTMRHATVMGNAAPHVSNSASTGVTSRTSLAANIFYTTAGTSAFCGGTIVSSGYNHIGGVNSSADLVGACAMHATDVVGAFVLGSLANNGGPTQTIRIWPLTPGSSLTNLVDGGSANCPSMDQTGMSRPIDGNDDGTSQCDPGAYEGR